MLRRGGQRSPPQHHNIFSPPASHRTCVSPKLTIWSKSVPIRSKLAQTGSSQSQDMPTSAKIGSNSADSNVAEIGQSRSQVGRHRPRAWLIWLASARIWSMPCQTCPMSADYSPNLDNFGTNSAEIGKLQDNVGRHIGQIRPRLGRTRSRAAQVRSTTDKALPTIGRHRPKFGRRRPSNVRVQATLGRAQSVFFPRAINVRSSWVPVLSLRVQIWGATHSS